MDPPRSSPRLDRGWIIANHKLVSFHAAFLTSPVSIRQDLSSRADVIREMFFSSEVVISAAMWYVAWHANIAIHEMGHYLAAVKTNNLRPELAGPAPERLNRGALRRWLWYLEMFVKIPYGAFPGVTKEAGSFHPTVKAQNLAVSAAGPRASAMLALLTLPLGILLVVGARSLGGLVSIPAAALDPVVYAGRVPGSRSGRCSTASFARAWRLSWPRAGSAARAGRATPTTWGRSCGAIWLAGTCREASRASAAHRARTSCSCPSRARTASAWSICAAMA